jgi:uncharacterized repeat protein (TIGR03806 family)
VGAEDFEEIDLVRSGGDYGWSVREGLHCLPPTTDCEVTGFESPIAEPYFGFNQAIIGGYVYRGTAIPSLYGAYLFGDFNSRELYALHYDEGGGMQSLGVATPRLLWSFGVDAAGELYALSAYPTEDVSGKLYKLVEQPALALPSDFPRKLSDTGCFESLQPLRPARGLTPYAVNVPLWADSALVQRFVQPGTMISVTDAGALLIPHRSVFVQTFFLEQEPGDRETRQVVETRILVKQTDGLRAYSYRWNQEQTDATLLDGEASRTLELTREGESLEYTYRFPSPTQCLGCHSEARGGILGFELRQLQRPFAFPPDCRERDQVEALAAFHVLGRVATSDAPFARLDDTDASTEQRARSYLHVQCVSCHGASLARSTLMNLDFALEFEYAQTCDALPLQGDLGVADARILDPGNPDKSLLYLRIADSGDGMMPPRPDALVDHRAAALVRAWIEGRSCP